MALPTLKLNTRDQKVCKKKNLSWLFGVDRKIHPSGSQFSITRHSLVMPNSDPQMFFFYLHLTLMKDSYILICFPMNYRNFSVKINSENNSENTIFIFTVCKKHFFYEFSAKSLAQKV